MTIHPALVGRTCYHRYEIGDGLYTPGTFLDVKPGVCLDELGVPQNLSGLRVLDIGAFDGAYSFELARRGAQVTALDIQDPNITVFNAVNALHNQAVNYVRGSVYHLNRETHGEFDLILFAGVYYHLKSPIAALQRIREVLVDKGKLFLEGASCSVHLAKLFTGMIPGTRDEQWTELLDRLPLSFFDSDHLIYAHWSNWWFPTSSCLRGMLRDCGFRDVQVGLAKTGFNQYKEIRIIGHAAADPAKQHPSDPQYENLVLAEDFFSRQIPLGPKLS